MQLARLFRIFFMSFPIDFIPPLTIKIHTSRIQTFLPAHISPAFQFVNLFSG